MRPDFALIAWYTFVLFFIGLVIYLRREDRREAYPLEHEGTGKTQSTPSFVFLAEPKIFRLFGGRGMVAKPDFVRDTRPVRARRTSITPGSPLHPLGDPMLAGVGPGSYAERAKTPELTSHGEPKILPMRVAADFVVSRGDRDPRGFRVKGCDGKVAGTVTDLWVDRAESLIRYFEVALPTGVSVLLPMPMAVVKGSHHDIHVNAITAAQFAAVPQIASPNMVTLDEEERIVAYYGGGYLYAKPGRTEPPL